MSPTNTESMCYEITDNKQVGGRVMKAYLHPPRERSKKMMQSKRNSVPKTGSATPTISQVKLSPMQANQQYTNSQIFDTMKCHDNQEM